MKQSLFCSFDRASQSFGLPFCAPHAGIACRSFSDAIRNPNKDSDISMHPDDFDLFELGVFDTQDASIQVFERPKLLLQGKQVALEIIS